MKFFIIYSIIKFVFCELNEWTDPQSNTYYNYDGLKRNIDNPWTVKKNSGIFSDVFRFNFGVKLNGVCHKGASNVAETMEVYDKPTPTCSLFGQSENKEMSLINPADPDKGIIVIYTNGDRCNSSHQGFASKSTHFILNCSPMQDENVKNYIYIV
jgi:hypothetical protein